MIWILSIISAVCFWIGGRSWGHKLVRRLGCPILALILILIWFGFKLHYIWIYLIFCSINVASLSTYFDFWGRKGILPNGETYLDETPLTWTICGFFYGISAFPLLWIGISWQSFILRIIILTMTIPLIRKIGQADIEEILSGFVYIASMLTLKA